MHRTFVPIASPHAVSRLYLLIASSLHASSRTPMTSRTLHISYLYSFVLRRTLMHITHYTHPKTHLSRISSAVHTSHHTAVVRIGHTRRTLDIEH
ncbi:hypothetical protein C8Q74DRAFT_913283 [Fomes fomentarius]|nr:hypothetical protein C8Q74DRAFT_913283 [Fomes fomentarius]